MIAVCVASVGTISAAVVDVDLAALLVVRLVGPGGVCNTVRLGVVVGTCNVNFPGSVGRMNGSGVGIELYVSSGITRARKPNWPPPSVVGTL